MPSRVWGPGGESVSWDLFLIDLCLSCMVCFSTGAIQVCVARCEPFVQMQLSRKIRCVAKLTTVARVRAVSRKVGNVANMREVSSRADRLVSPSFECVLFPSLKMWNSEKKEKHNGNKSTSVGWLLTTEATIESAERRLCPPGSSSKPRVASNGRFGHHPFSRQFPHCDDDVSPFWKENGADWEQGAPRLRQRCTD